VQYGDHGENVRRIQEALIAAGYHGVGETNGNFGHETDAAVRYFQAVNRLNITGHVDETTAMALGIALAEHGDDGAARGDAGAHHPVVTLIDVTYSQAALSCRFENHGIEARGYLTFHFEGPSVHTFQEEAQFFVGAGAEWTFHLPEDIPSGHYRVTVYANVTDANPHGDSQLTAEFDHHPEPQQ
jgi:peptidoglycan hydrolase-like protein with peptidoglycan-binding domain